MREADTYIHVYVYIHVIYIEIVYVENIHRKICKCMDVSVTMNVCVYLHIFIYI